MRAGKPVSDRRRWVAVCLLWGLGGVGALADDVLKPTSAAPAASPQAPVAAGTPRVAEIELRVDAPLPKGLSWRKLCAFAPGDPLSEASVRRTLSNFYATGRVEEAEVLARPRPQEPGAVTAVVVVRLRPWVQEVEIIGDLGLPERSLQRVIRQKPSNALSQELLAASRDALLELYWRQGFRQPQVAIEVRSVSEKQVIVTFEVDAGPQATVGSIAFAGDLQGFTAERLAKVIRTEAGRAYSYERLQQDVERLRRWWLRQGFLGVRLGDPDEIYDSEAQRLHLTFNIVAGERVEVEVLGASKRRLTKLGLLTFLRDSSFDDDLIQQSCQRLVSHYQRRGHYRAEVDCRLMALDDGGQKLTLEVSKGAKFQIEAIGFQGNEQIDESRLTPLMSTSVKRPLSPGSGHLVDADLAEDLANLRSFYLLQGYTEAQVGEPRVVTDGQRLSLEIPLQEGPRQRVVEVTWEGHRVFDDAEIARSLALRNGGPYHPARLEESINVLRTLYEDRGYPSATITPRLDWNAEKTLIDVHLQIKEGPPSLLDRVLIRGLQRTREAPVLRAMGLKPGDPLSRRVLLEAERELYRLGIFSRVDVDLAPSSELSGARDVIVQVEEGQRWRLGYGFSYHSDDGLGGLFSLVRNNIGGRGDRFQADFRGNDVENRFRLIFDQPSFLKTNLPITFILFREEEVRQAFSVDGTGAQVSLTKDWRANRLGLIYDYRRVETVITDATLELDELEREDRSVEISSLTPNLFIDRRDDPLNPNLGWSTNLQLEFAFPLLDAEANFLKLFWQQTQYTALGRFGSLASSFRLGAIEGLSDSAPLGPLVPEDFASARIPISERFFGGGRTSHRAFERDRLGIVGDTLISNGDGDFVEVGGNGLVVLNLDYRFPISGDFGGTVFFDLGNVWADWRDIDVDDLEPGAGLGFRYTSPIGPIRLEIGWQLDPDLPGGDDPVFFLSFGNPF